VNTYTISTPQMLRHYAGYREGGRWCYDVFAPSIDFIARLWRIAAGVDDSVRIWRTA
jgi:hypothetical protein